MDVSEYFCDLSPFFNHKYQVIKNAIKMGFVSLEKSKTKIRKDLPTEMHW